MHDMRRAKSNDGTLQRTVATGHAVAAGLLLCGGLVLLDARRASSQPPPPAPPAAAEGTGETELKGPRITINGYLSQAYAIANGNLVLGIPKSGTADYRTAAVQMRVDMTPQDTFSVKVRNERLGQSGVQPLLPDLALDWLFYEHKFGDSSIKVGRVKIPFGIYNEVRDVGTLLPFYRPSADFYGTGSFTTEAIDGLDLSHSFDFGAGWQLDGDLYGGNWEYIAIDSEISGFDKSKAQDTAGLELWLTTPLPGLRIGAGGMRFDVLTPGIAKRHATNSHISLDEELGRVVAQVEYKHSKIGDAVRNGGYAHLGVKLSDRITVNGQLEFDNLSIMEAPSTIHLDRDTALGIGLSLRRDLLLKAEYHWNKGFSSEGVDLFGPPLNTRYGIVSLSVAF